MPSPSPSPEPRLDLPPGYVERELLSLKPGGGRVLRATDPSGRSVVLRLDPRGQSEELRAELSVLAACDVPGIARLLDHGPLPGRGRYLAREWIEGERLDRWSSGRTAEERVRVLVPALLALEGLHRRGFVHGDLKAENLVVATGRKDPAAVLTDFGLAQRSDARRESVAGSFFHLAPELLHGLAPSPASDLFAFGALLHRSLLEPSVSAERFHGCFPADDYFAASQTRVEDLPEWARDLVPALLERDPAARIASAAELARQLGLRLGLATRGELPDLRPRWTVSTGREEWIELVLERSRDGRCAWIRCAGALEARALADELRLRAALGDRPTRRLDAGREFSAAADTRAVDAQARRLADDTAETLLLAVHEGEERWVARGLEQLARAQKPERARGALLVLGTEEPPDPEAWEREALPPVGRREIEARLRAWLPAPGDPEGEQRLTGLADLLARAAGGDALELDRALERALSEGLLATDERGLRFGPLALPAELSSAAPAPVPDDLSEEGARLLAGLASAHGRLALADASELVGSPAALARALADPRVAGRVEHVQQTLAARELPSLEALARVLGPRAWRALNEARALQLARSGAALAQLLPLRFRAGMAALADVLEEARLLRERGCAELALDLARACLTPEPDGEAEAALRAEAASAWCVLGRPERALELVAPLAAPERPAPQRARAELVRAQVASARHETALALEHLDAAVALGVQRAELALARARLSWDLRRDEDVLALCASVLGEQVPPDSREGANLRAIAAMSRFRLGRVDEARAELEELLSQARSDGDGAREAGLRIDLGTLERRAGDRARALEHFRLAGEHYDRAGHLPGLAQARALEGGALREAGELARAEPLLASALELRERLGDRAGAEAVRGMVGLLRADRGHARPALAELESAARALVARGRSTDALLLEARADELRARLRQADPRGDEGPLLARREGAAQGDPRILLSAARAAALRGAREEALELVRRAAGLADRIGHAQVVAEASLCRRLLLGEAPPVAELEPASTAGEDARLVAALSRAPFDEHAVAELAEELARRGRDDRAARAFLALAVRGEPRLAEARAQRMEAALARCARGCTPEEREALAGALLGLPDPWPEDWNAWCAGRRAGLVDRGELERLLEINRLLLSQEELSALLGAIVEQALEVSGAQRGFLVLEREGVLEVDTALESSRGDLDPREVELSTSLLATALEEMRPVRVASALDDPRLASAPSVLALELRSVLCVPFAVRDGLRGAIWVDHRLREHAFDEHAQHVLDLLGGQAALAIRQVERLAEIRRLNRQLKREVERQESDLRSARRLLREASLPSPVGGLVGDSAAMRRVHHVIERGARSRLAVLVCGQSGTGKELAARAVHASSERASGPFVSENCAALPPTLIEAELFGVRRGAYTGAERDREGLFERAHGGTLFLDEIGELPLELQGKLLRVLETSEVRRLGDERTRPVDFRLVTATNRQLATEVREGRFRADLLYRLDGLRLDMPSIAERSEDIPLLVDHYLRLRSAPHEEPRRLSPAVLARLVARPWPGNVRELFNELERLCVLSEGEIDEPSLVRMPLEEAPRTGGAGGVRPMAEVEREAIEQALLVAEGDKRRAAELLGISRATIYERLRRWREGDGSPA